MNKFNFIKQLLENEKFSASQKDRFLKLVSKELESFSKRDDQVIIDIINIKKKIGFDEVKSEGEKPMNAFELLVEERKEKIHNKKSIFPDLKWPEAGKENSLGEYMVDMRETKKSKSFAEQYKEAQINKTKDNIPLEFPKLNNAPSLVKLMNQFSDNSKALKYTTHSWEYGKFQSFEEFTIKIKEEWNDISKELTMLNPRLSAKISNFLFNNKLGEKKDEKYYHVWGEKRLKFGWASKPLELYMKNSENDPFSFSIPENIKSLDTKHNLLLFDQYVSEFKNEIEIREDNSALVNLINFLWTSELGYDFNLVQQDTEGVSFFTDVPYLKSVIKIVFGSFKKRPQFPNIICRIDENFEENYVELSITQLESKCTRSINDPKILKPKGGDLSTIIENLKNLADFSVIGEFKDEQVYRVNYLTSNREFKHLDKKDENYLCDGFTYLLKFYL
ncbi:hypothetical protein [Bizionia paragorgiae]|uniref:Histidine Kinase domain-containing protein n=1 Tax=Bizionia paragorgiae TaxID=283786 RepID=A0A1H3X0L1_BIZPA|nr:hypothetical protein [Bizionia paragorgiae]SDZ92917.1 hypothetical protein SAMN04487990_10494 [Bizionia paragorgiae]